MATSKSSLEASFMVLLRLPKLTGWGILRWGVAGELDGDSLMRLRSTLLTSLATVGAFWALTMASSSASGLELCPVPVPDPPDGRVPPGTVAIGPVVVATP